VVEHRTKLVIRVSYRMIGILEEEEEEAAAAAAEGCVRLTAANV